MSQGQYWAGRDSSGSKQRRKGSSKVKAVAAGVCQGEVAVGGSAGSQDSSRCKLGTMGAGLGWLLLYSVVAALQLGTAHCWEVHG